MQDFPDFIIAGCAKSGTTALYHMLDQHRDIFMSRVKETNYFVHAFEDTRRYVDHRDKLVIGESQMAGIIDSLEKYRTMFDGARPDQLLGEASPWYFLNTDVPARILRHRADIRIIMILRNPTEVALANFMHQVRAGSETLSVSEVDRILDERHYDRRDLYPFCRHLDVPRYATYLPIWFDTFDASRMHLMIYEQFRHNRRAALSELFNFLGITDNVSINVDRRVNISGVPRSVLARNFIQGNNIVKQLAAAIVPVKPRRLIRSMLESLNTNPSVTIPEAVQARLDRFYETDRAFVESLLGRQVSHWRQRRQTA